MRIHYERGRIVDLPVDLEAFLRVRYRAMYDRDVLAKIEMSWGEVLQWRDLLYMNDMPPPSSFLEPRYSLMGIPVDILSWEPSTPLIQLDESLREQGK